MNSTQTKKVPATAITGTVKMKLAASFATRLNRAVATIVARFGALRYGVALLCVLAGYGFASASNFIPAAVCALIGVVAADCPEQFYRWLHRVRAAADAALDGIEPTGAYYGDGTPRDQSGQPYEPLDWPEGLRRI